jgi:hypothetical protein
MGADGNLVEGVRQTEIDDVRAPGDSRAAVTTLRRS